jgi:hypothetical protein
MNLLACVRSKRSIAVSPPRANIQKPPFLFVFFFSVSFSPPGKSEFLRAKHATVMLCESKKKLLVGKARGLESLQPLIVHSSHDLFETIRH